MCNNPSSVNMRFLIELCLYKTNPRRSYVGLALSHAYLVNGNVNETALTLIYVTLSFSRDELVRLNDMSAGPEQSEVKHFIETKVRMVLQRRMRSGDELPTA